MTIVSCSECHDRSCSSATAWSASGRWRFRGLLGERFFQLTQFLLEFEPFCLLEFEPLLVFRVDHRFDGRTRDQLMVVDTAKRE